MDRDRELLLQGHWRRIRSFLLLDEPFAAIDAKIRQELRTWLKDMIEKLGITSIFVTHDQDEAIEVADEIIITNRGHIEQKGSPVEVYQSPETAFSASFFGQAAIVKDYHIFNYFEDVDGSRPRDCPSGIYQSNKKK